MTRTPWLVNSDSGDALSATAASFAVRATQSRLGSGYQA
jgi:hypothetical protein